jgi:hypothetical protein
MDVIGCTWAKSEKIPVESGPCADKIKEVFGVGINVG